MSTSVGENGAMSPSRVTLMERQRDEKGDVSMLAQLRIVELDKLVARVKQRQHNCLAAIEHYENEIRHINKEVENIMARYDPMVRRLDQRKTERVRLQAQLEVVTKQFGDILMTTKKHLQESSHEHLRHVRNEASSELSAARGYSLGRESTMYQKGQFSQK